MSKCFNPECLNQNNSNDKFCQKCGNKIILRERYRALKIIGKGGFGRTFLAIDEDKPSKPKCVIKQFLPQAQGTASLQKASELFEEEAKHLDNLGKHEQIPELLAYFTQDNRQYLIQQFIEGENLLQELSKGNYNEQKIRALLIEILEILKYVHENKVIHRDIKPENIIRRLTDKKLFLVDFGASKVVENTRLSVTGTVIGSAQYCAPEQSFGKPQYCSDLYSLGVTCLQLLTGIEPFDLFDSGDGEWIWRDYLVNNPVSEEIGKILDKLVVSGYKKRYQSAEEVLSILRPVRLTSKQTSYSLPITTIVMPVSQTPVKKATQPHSNFTETFPSGVKLEMIAINAGEFMMGSNQDDCQKPVHKVKLKEFYISKYPITQAQYQEIMGNNPSYFKTKSKGLFSNKENCLEHPVEQVTWDMAQEFCRKLSKKTGKEYQLPTEAQWEYACRAGSTTEYHFGYNVNQLKDYAWYSNNLFAADGTHPVGQKKPNNWGLYDMSGNVCEWCQDNWQNNYNNHPSDGTAVQNDSGKFVQRGGWWCGLDSFCRSADRDCFRRSYKSNLLGFRIVCVCP